jgi:hypothetical protein
MIRRSYKKCKLLHKLSRKKMNKKQQLGGTSQSLSSSSSPEPDFELLEQQADTMTITQTIDLVAKIPKLYKLPDKLQRNIDILKELQELRKIQLDNLQLYAQQLQQSQQSQDAQDAQDEQDLHLHKLQNEQDLQDLQELQKIIGGVSFEYYMTLPICKINIELSRITQVSRSNTNIVYNVVEYVESMKGHFGTVYINIEKKEAIKKINTTIKTVNKLITNEIINYYNISTLVCKDTNDFFCKFKNAYYVPLKNTIYILMEYCGTDLQTILHNNGHKIDPKVLYRWFITIANGIQCMHANNYVHLDIKPANITIIGDLTDLSQCQAKLIDFGLAKNILDIILSPLKKAVGTKGYVAPELLHKDLRKTITEYRKCDIYSLGRTFEKALFHGSIDPLKRTLESIESIELHEMISDSPIIRPTIDAVISKLTTILVAK